MVDFPVNVKNGVNKRIADEAIKQFEAKEFNIFSKELSLKRAILVHDSHFTIYESEYRGSAVAVKVVAVEETQQISDFIDAVVDLTSLASLRHDNISTFYGAGYTLNSENKLREIMIVTEPFERSTLRSLLKKSLGWATKISLARDIARAISYLHDQSVIHGDIRTSTILVNEQNQAKLVDFAHLCGERSRLETRTFNTTKGTVALSPEMARNQMYDFGADVYAFGMLLFELITETPPNKNFRYRNAHGGFALLEAELRAAVKPGCPVGLEALAYSCCETKAARRLIAPQVVDELDFLLIELSRKPDDPRLTSPLKRSSSSTNKYAHLLLPSPGSSKNLLTPKPSAADLTSSTPTSASKPAPAPVELSSLTPVKAELEKVPEHDEESESLHSVHSIAEALASKEAEASPISVISTTASASASADVTKDVEPSPALDKNYDSSVDKAEENVVDASLSDSAAQASAVPMSGKNKRRKGMLDPTTAQKEDPIELPQPKPVKPAPTEPAPTETEPVIMSADEALSLIASIKHIVHDALEPSADTDETPLTAEEVSHINLEPLVDEGTNTSPRAETAEKFIFVLETPFAARDGPEVSHGASTATGEPVVPRESASAGKKKSRSRAKIDYAAEPPLQPEPPAASPPLPLETPLSASVKKLINSEGGPEMVSPSAAKSASDVRASAASAPTDSGRKQAVSVDFAPAPARRVSVVSAPVETTASAPALTVTTAPLLPAAPAPTAFIPPVPPPPAAPIAQAPIAAPAPPVPASAPQDPPAVERRRSVLLPPGDYINITDIMSHSPVPLRKEDAHQEHGADEAGVTDIAASEAESAHRRSSMPELLPLTSEREFPVFLSSKSVEQEVVTLSEAVPVKNVSESAKSVAFLPTEPSAPEPSKPDPLAADSAPLAVLSASSVSAAPLPLQFEFNSSAAPTVTADAPASSSKASRPGRKSSSADAEPVPIPASIRATEAAMAVAAAQPPVLSVPPPPSSTPVVSGPLSGVDTTIDAVKQEVHGPTDEISVSATKRTRGTRGGKNRNKHKGADSASASPVPVEPKMSPPESMTASIQLARKVRPADSFEDIFTPAAVSAPVIPEPSSVLANAKETAIAATPSSPASKIETSLFQSPAGEKGGLTSNQKRRLRREQARIAAAAFISAADAAEEVIVERGPASKSSELVPAILSCGEVTRGGADEAVEVYTPKYPPPPPPVPAVVPAPVNEVISAVHSAPAPAAPAVASQGQDVFSSPPRSHKTASAATSTESVAQLETPPVKAPASPLRSPCGSLPVPAPHRHVHHFDLPAPQVTPPMHFPVSSQALAHLPDPPASPSSPIPHKQEPSEHSEIVQTVFSDKDANISAGKKMASQSAYSTPHRTVEKVNRSGVPTQADDSHSKILRAKILSPAAASQKAVLAAPPAQVVSVSAPVVSAYEERMMAMERRLQQLAEENLALQRDLHAAVSKQSTTSSAASVPSVHSAAPAPGLAFAEHDVLTASDVTLTDASAATLGSVPRRPHQLADSAAPRSPARSSLGAVLQSFEQVALSEGTKAVEVEVKVIVEDQETEVRSVDEESRSESGSESESESESDSEESVPHEEEAGRKEAPLPTEDAIAAHVEAPPAPTPDSAADVAVSTSTPEPPVATSVPSAEPVPAAPATPAAPVPPTGYVDVLKYLEAMQTDLRSQLSALHVPSTPTPAPAPASAPAGDASAPHTASQTVSHSALNSAPPSTPAVVLQSTTEAELQLQSQIASAIDSKLGAVQAQISQFSTLLNAILLAQSPMPGARPMHDDLSQNNSQNSTHSSAFVTPNSVMGSISQPFESEDEPGASPSSPSLSPQKLFSQIDQPAFGAGDMPGLIPSSEFQPFSARRPSGEVSETVNVQNQEKMWSASDAHGEESPVSDSGEKIIELAFEAPEKVFDPSNTEGEESEDPRSDGDKSENESESAQTSAEQSPSFVTDARVDVPSFVPFSSATVPAAAPSFQDENEQDHLWLEPAPALLPLQPVSEASTAPVRKSLSPASVETSAEHNTLAEIGHSAVEEELPLEAWEIKAIKVTAQRVTPPPPPPSATPLSAPVTAPVTAPAPSDQTSEPPSPVPSGAPAKPPKPPKQTAVVLETAPTSVVSDPTPEPEPIKREVSKEVEKNLTEVEVRQQERDHEDELNALSDANDITSDSAVTKTPFPSTVRAPTPEGRAASPFLRNRVPFPLSTHDGPHSQFPRLYGEPELAEIVSEAVKDAAASIAESAGITEPQEPVVSIHDTDMSASKVLEAVEEELRALENHAYVPNSKNAAHTEAVSSVPPAPVDLDSAVSTPSSTRSSRESSVIDASDIEYPYAQEAHLPAGSVPVRSLPAAVLALHQHHENQQRAYFAEQEQQLQEELAETHNSYAYGSYHHNAPPQLSSSQESVSSTHSHHSAHNVHKPVPMSSPKQDSPPAKVLSTSMKFLEELSKLNNHYDAKEEGPGQDFVPNRRPLDYSRSPQSTQVDLRQPQVGQPSLYHAPHTQHAPHGQTYPHSAEKHLRVSPHSSLSRIGDGHPEQPTYPLSTAHIVHRHSPLLRSNTPPVLQRPLIHSDPYLEHHSPQHSPRQQQDSAAKAPTESFQSPQRTYGTPGVNTQSTLSNSGDRSRRPDSSHSTPYNPLLYGAPHHQQQQSGGRNQYTPYQYALHAPHASYEQHDHYRSPPLPQEEEEDEPMEDVSTQRLADLTGVLNNFLSVIEKCSEISHSADQAVSQLDRNMSRMDQRSHRKVTAGARSASFAPNPSFYEPPPLPPLPSSPLARYNSSGSIRLDEEYDARYVEYEGSDDERSAARSRTGSLSVSRSRTNSAANFDSTSNIDREPVHTKHFLSPSTKPALLRFDKSASQQSLHPASSFRSATTPSNNSYFKAGLGIQVNNTSSGVSVSGRSAVSKSPSVTRKPEGLPSRKPAVPLQGSRGRSTSRTRTDRAASFASTIGTVVSGLSSVGESDRAQQQHQQQQHLNRTTSFSAELHRSSDSDHIIVDGRVQPLRRSGSQQGLTSILRQNSTESAGVLPETRGRSNSQISGMSIGAHSRSNSPRSRSRSPRSQSPHRMPSPKEIQSKFNNVMAYTFRSDTSARRIC